MSVVQTLITVGATLAGTITGTVLTSALKMRADRDGRAHEWHGKFLDYSAQLVSCLSSHRKAMWDLEAARLRGDQDEIAATLQASEVTRDAIDDPQLRIILLAPQLEPQIVQTAQAIYALDTVTNLAGRSEERLADQLIVAKVAIEDLKYAMSSMMRKVGAGLTDHTRPARRRSRQAARTSS